MPDKTVTVKALKPLKKSKVCKKDVPIGGTTELPESVANALKTAGAVEIVKDEAAVSKANTGDNK